jgi:5-deoxy-glucuronate isomerase
VFHGPSDVLYSGTGRAVSITSADGGRVAVATAPAKDAYPTRLVTAAETPVELRGAGNCSRQVHNFGTPAALEADRFIVCEVLTPAGNWSSYPPHKHDEEKDGETHLEEIYYFETRVADGSAAPADADAIGYQRVYASDERPIDVSAEVRTGDVVLVPYGWHGPAMAAPGYDLYYLNVMAGPGPVREWLISDDPHHGWVRQTWDGQDVDPRLPFGACRLQAPPTLHIWTKTHTCRASVRSAGTSATGRRPTLLRLAAAAAKAMTAAPTSVMPAPAQMGEV